MAPGANQWRSTRERRNTDDHVPVKDIARAKALYNDLLGVEPIMDQPHYVGDRVGGQDVGLDPNGHSKGMTIPVG
jgi:catechol 2,3-dioxygenase-like lactoylglutathione lyase family enzyme